MTAPHLPRPVLMGASSGESLPARPVTEKGHVIWAKPNLAPKPHPLGNPDCAWESQGRTHSLSSFSKYVICLGFRYIELSSAAGIY